MFPCHMSVLVYIFIGKAFWGLAWSFQTEEEGNHRFRFHLCSKDYILKRGSLIMYVTAIMTRIDAGRGCVLF